MWLYLKTGCLYRPNKDNMKLLGEEANIICLESLQKEEIWTQTDTEGRQCEEKGRPPWDYENTHLQVTARTLVQIPAVITALRSKQPCWCLDFRLIVCGTTNFCHWSHPVCGSLLQQLLQIDTTVTYPVFLYGTYHHLESSGLFLISLLTVSMEIVILSFSCFVHLIPWLPEWPWHILRSQ